MRIGVVTLFPEMFHAISEYGVCGRAVKNSLLDIEFWNPRDFTSDKHRTVDDKPFGGGPGMLMKTEPLVAAIRQAREAIVAKRADQGVGQELDSAGTSGKKPLTVYLSPQGSTLDQEKVIALSQTPEIVLVCGRYQGIDSRVVESEIDEEISLGDFVLSGGEIAAMALIDAVIRFQPGALGDDDSASNDSFAQGLLHCPQYTRPQEFEGAAVPEELLSGDHAAIERWRLKQSLGTTWLKRPDLLEKVELDEEQQGLLEQFKNEYLAKD